MENPYRIKHFSAFLFEHDVEDILDR